MKNLIIIIALLTSCSSDWHLRRAKFKQPNILQQYNDTIRMRNIRIDTIYYADTFSVIHTLTEYDTIIQTRYLKPETRYQIRYRRREANDSLKHVLKLYKTQMNALNDSIKRMARVEIVKARQENRTDRTKSRRLWWLWLIIGAVGGIFIYRKI